MIDKTSSIDADRFKDNLLAKVTHELKTPLNSLMLLGDLSMNW